MSLLKFLQMICQELFPPYTIIEGIVCNCIYLRNTELLKGLIIILIDIDLHTRNCFYFGGVGRSGLFRHATEHLRSFM